MAQSFHDVQVSNARYWDMDVASAASMDECLKEVAAEETPDTNDSTSSDQTLSYAVVDLVEDSWADMVLDQVAVHVAVDTPGLVAVAFVE